MSLADSRTLQGLQRSRLRPAARSQSIGPHALFRAADQCLGGAPQRPQTLGTTQALMEQLRDFSDDRLVLGCIFCGGQDETREHVPSRAFLDVPYPENLPVVGACRQCNGGFASDEEYLACLIEVVVAGSTDPQAMRRPKIARTLAHADALRTRLEAARETSEAGTLFHPEVERVQRVLTKLAAGHAAYELARSHLDSPIRVWWRPIDLLEPADRDAFEAPDVTPLYGEVGTRGMHRMMVLQFSLMSDSGERLEEQVLVSDWVEVQPGRYRYHASDDGESVSVRMVIGDYLAVEVEWES